MGLTDRQGVDFHPCVLRGESRNVSRDSDANAGTRLKGPSDLAPRYPWQPHCLQRHQTIDTSKPWEPILRTPQRSLAVAYLSQILRDGQYQ